MVNALISALGGTLDNPFPDMIKRNKKAEDKHMMLVTL